MKKECKCKAKGKKKICVYGKLLIAAAAVFGGYKLYKSKKD